MGDDAPCVILLHGMAQTSLSMLPMAHDLERAGYRVRNIGYPTRPHDVAELAERYLKPAIAASGTRQPVHLVTHSLGGILARWYLQDHDLPTGSRIVMLAPPNHGSEVADVVRHWPPYRWFMGAVGQQLGTGADGIVRQLEPVCAEVGVIAGRRSIQPWFSWLLPGDDDGAVSVASTRLDEMRDFIVVDASHTLLMFNGKVRRQVRHFLRHGSFEH
ncbi:MAG: alpha/beta fold hydrolase [Gammaproteobacteria bacterium]|nr:alpha/beta fold hydrolase [Gammaproteobacteria bacterium]